MTAQVVCPLKRLNGDYTVYISLLGFYMSVNFSMFFHFLVFVR